MLLLVLSFFGKRHMIPALRSLYVKMLFNIYPGFENQFVQNEFFIMELGF